MGVGEWICFQIRRGQCSRKMIMNSLVEYIERDFGKEEEMCNVDTQ